MAGRVIEGDVVGDWIRPVSARRNQAVSSRERQYVGGREPQVLDIVELPLEGPCPEGYQIENWLLSTSDRWKKTGSLPFDCLQDFAGAETQLWANGFQTIVGRNNRIPSSQAEGLCNSLQLIRTDAVRIQVFSPGQDYGNQARKIQARFAHGGEEYWIRVTDRIIEDEYLSREIGFYDLGPSYVTVSLTKPHDDGFIYKLVAAIIREPA